MILYWTVATLILICLGIMSSIYDDLQVDDTDLQMIATLIAVIWPVSIIGLLIFGIWKGSRLFGNYLKRR